MDERTLDVLRVIASRERWRIVLFLKQGVHHPADLGRRLGVSRQSVDKHLALLYRYGIVTRDAVTSPMGRPRIEYEVSPEALELFEELDGAVEGYTRRLKEALQRELSRLDRLLAEGKLDERGYLERLNQLKSRLSPLL